VIRVEAVDTSTASDETLGAIYRIEEACFPQPWRSENDAVLFMRHPPGNAQRCHWLAFDGDEPSGMMRLTMDSESFAWTHLRVLPDHRRRGIGRTLFEAARAVAGDCAIGGHHFSPEGAAFAQALGARDEQRDVRSELDLRSAQLAAPAVPEGYVLRSWIGAAPDDVVESYASARNAIDDAPAPDGQTFPTYTVEYLRGQEDAVARRGRELRVTVALAGDEVAAFTEIRVSPAPAVRANTEDTATVREHRGKGLAQAVKAESLHRLRADRPDVETVETLNAEENGPMRAVNAKLGFVPVVTLTTAVLRRN
jgi:GNAT superfamily N-acetyltransferase